MSGGWLGGVVNGGKLPPNLLILFAIAAIGAQLLLGIVDRLVPQEVSIAAELRRDLREMKGYDAEQLQQMRLITAALERLSRDIERVENDIDALRGEHRKP